MTTSPSGERMRLGSKISRSSGVTAATFAVSSRWFVGESEIRTYMLDELLGTKMRALYQRKKIRDLFDLAVALERGAVDPARIVATFLRYMEHGGHKVSRAEFEQNIEAKLRDAQFSNDIGPLALRPVLCPIQTQGRAVRSQLIARLAGGPWQGDGNKRLSRQ